MIISWRGYKLFALLLLTLHCGNLFSQKLNEEAVVPVELRKRVYGIETFINRFNNREDLFGNRKLRDSVTEQFVAERTQYILSLFDHERFRNARVQAKGELIEFVRSVNSLESQLYLDFYDSHWYAAVQVDVLYRKKPKEITVYMVVEQTGERVSKWAIYGVKADFLTLGIDVTTDTTDIIPPNSHGTDFIGLPGYLSGTRNIVSLTSRSRKLDQLSVFLYAAQTGEIDFKVAKNVSYHFLQIPNWIIKVREFSRNSENSGWLVEELIKADDAQKSDYVRQLLSVNKS